MKMSKKERRAYNLGRKNGYIEGYKDGLHDGNPFISLAEDINKAIGVISERLTDPEFIEYCKRVTERFMKTLETCENCGADMKGATE